MVNYPAVLLLNASYEALDLVPWQNAVVLLVKNKATIHQPHASGATIRSQKLTVDLPAVIVLTRYVYVPYQEADEHTAASLSAVLKRDNYTCGYCGQLAATVDHIVPKSRGGTDTYGNLIAACVACNQIKADLTPEEAGMRLLWQPWVPSHQPVRQRQIWRELAIAP